MRSPGNADAELVERLLERRRVLAERVDERDAPSGARFSSLARARCISQPGRSLRWTIFTSTTEPTDCDELHERGGRLRSLPHGRP